MRPDLSCVSNPSFRGEVWSKASYRSYPLAGLLMMLLIAMVSARADEPAAGSVAGEKERIFQAGDTFRECERCPRMVVIPPGSFTMGRNDGADNEGPAHAVTIAHSFAVSVYLITVTEWKACVDAGPCPADRGDDWGEGFPITGPSWDDAQAYVGWLSRITGETYRLLTESEFEYMAWDALRPSYPWGLAQPAASCIDCGSEWDGRSPSPVAAYPPNRFGVHDAVSNAVVMVQDCYHDNFDGAPIDGSAWENGECWDHVVRGGSWAHLSNDLNAKRRSLVDKASYPEVGFRIARTLPKRPRPDGTK
jgi:formylglycine-generating enzyme required for sulfatase activity